jgi:hypothetical protein
MGPLSSLCWLYKGTITVIREFGFSCCPFFPSRNETISLFDGSLIDHFIDLLFFLLTSLVVDEGGLVLLMSFLFLLLLVLVLTLIALLSLFFFCMYFILLVLDKFRKDFIMPMPVSIGGGCVDDGRALISFQRFAVDAFGLGLLPHRVVL